MYFSREINRLVIGVMVVFTIIAIAAAYWAIVGPDTILQRSDNPRLVQAEASIMRGAILDRNNNILVASQKNPDETVTREYRDPAMYSAIGYSSLRYGVSGAEAAYNTVLRGDDIQYDFGDQFLRNLMHLPKQGSDIKLTFDQPLQEDIVQAMGQHQGAVVVLSVPTGEVLALVSLPTYDPNTLDANWETLTKAPGKPFFNRALQGNYQPGGTLETPLMAAAVLADYPLDTISSNASRPVQVGKVELSCIQPPKADALTLKEAYVAGCPEPFVEMMGDLGLGTVEAIFNAFNLNHPPELPGYVVSPIPEVAVTPEVVNLSGDNLLEDALGQGRLTITPLEMATIAAAIVNEGNAPTPYTLLGTRQPDSQNWVQNPDMHPVVPLMTVNTAHQLQDVMQASVTDGTGQRAAQDSLQIGGQATRAFSGSEAQSWFVGYVTWGNKQGAAIAVVVENSSDTSLAAQIGGQALASTYKYLH